jgi:3-hydroxyisobutyrate dehydrogenase-like beta-hydroxyacid dehydrogenase
MPVISDVAMYGLGNMGYLVAERIGKQFPVKVFDLSAAQVTRAKEQFGATPIERPEQLSDTRVVVLSLPDPVISLAVMRSLLPILPTGSVVIETSTVNPEDMHAARDLLRPRGIDVIDASVLAGVSQMADGSATLALGGPTAVIEFCRPVLDAIATRQIYFGELGAGAAAKVINNAVAHAVMAVVVEAGAMATAAGVDCGKLINVLSDAQMGIQRPLTHRYAERIVAGNFAGGMPLDAARKDSLLALRLAQNLGVPLFAIQASHSIYEMATTAGFGRDDYAAIAKLWSDWGRPAAPVQPQVACPAAG